MMEKAAQPAVRMRSARPPPFTISTITYKVVVYAPALRANTLPLFPLYPYEYYELAPITFEKLGQTHSGTRDKTWSMAISGLPL
jgi:hypothetical protein